MSEEQVIFVDRLAVFIKQSNIDYIHSVYDDSFYTFAIELLGFTNSYSIEQLQKAIIYLAGESDDLNIDSRAVLLKYLVNGIKKTIDVFQGGLKQMILTRSKI